MSNLFDQINQDIKTSMLAKDKETLDTLRMLLSAVRNKEISLRKGADVVLSDDDVLSVVSSEIKKRRDSAEVYEQGGRQDLAEKEKEEIITLNRYMPKQLSQKKLEEIVDEIIAKKSENDTIMFGAVMGEVMARVKGKADGKIVGEVVKTKLSK